MRRDAVWWPDWVSLRPAELDLNQNLLPPIMETSPKYSFAARRPPHRRQLSSPMSKLVEELEWERASGRKRDERRDLESSRLGRSNLYNGFFFYMGRVAGIWAGIIVVPEPDPFSNWSKKGFQNRTHLLIGTKIWIQTRFIMGRNRWSSENLGPIYIPISLHPCLHLAHLVLVLFLLSNPFILFYNCSLTLN